MRGLNNLLQPKRSPEEAAAKSEEVRQAIHKDGRHQIMSHTWTTIVFFLLSNRQLVSVAVMQFLSRPSDPHFLRASM